MFNMLPLCLLGCFVLFFCFRWGWLNPRLWRRVNDKNPFNSIFGLWNRKTVKSNLQPVITRRRSTTTESWNRSTTSNGMQMLYENISFFFLELLLSAPSFHLFQWFIMSELNTNSESDWDTSLGFLIGVCGSARFTFALVWTLHNPKFTLCQRSVGLLSAVCCLSTQLQDYLLPFICPANTFKHELWQFF